MGYIQNKELYHTVDLLSIVICEYKTVGEEQACRPENHPTPFF